MSLATIIGAVATAVLVYFFGKSSVPKKKYLKWRAGYEKRKEDRAKRGAGSESDKSTGVRHTED